MAFLGSGDSREGAPMAEINMIPLIDVMLVLLVIFIVTAPLLTHAVKIELPRASSTPASTRDETVQLGMDANGGLFWNGERVERVDMEARMAAAAKRDPQPELELRAERTTEYQQVAEILSAAARAGLGRIRFITEPAPGR